MEGSAARLLGPSGPLARAFEGYEEREGQLAMASAVERALHHDRVLLCEAGTGTGKTLAYLVPAIMSGKKVIVSTATKALQEQILVKDVPLVAEHLGLDPEVVLGKGLGNYLCLRRYNELRSSISAADPLVRRSLPIVEAWAEATETGDFAELTTLPEGDPLRREICSSSETRIGSGCTYFDRCFVTKMKREMERARIIVVNHHLFFADLAVKIASAARGFAGAGALPPYDAVIFDEAHELPSIATEFFGVRVTEARVASMLRDAERSFASAGLVVMRGAQRKIGDAPPRAQGEGGALIEIVREATSQLFAALARAASMSGTPSDSEGRAPLSPDVWAEGEPLHEAYIKVDERIEALASFAETASREEAVRLVAARAKEIRSDLAIIVRGGDNRVTWVDLRGRSAAIGASPIDLGPIFRNYVADRTSTTVLTSATLTTGSDENAFRYLRGRLGLDGEIAAPLDELVVPSPFDYPRVTLLYTPRDLPEAADPRFSAAASDRIAELIAITGGGAFVLCTSNRSMRAIASLLRGRTPMPLLVQGDAPKISLLRRFKSQRDGVLVATMSFWEGVDVPGDALRLVVIDKLPFAVPTDPVVRARSAAIEAAGESPFFSFAVPEAAITLKQGFGRLIRTRADRGIVAIFDRRLVVKSYGRALLASLPPARRTERIDDVAAFYSEMFGEQRAE